MKQIDSNSWNSLQKRQVDGAIFRGIVAFLLFLSITIPAQAQIVQVRTYDQQLKTMKNVEVSINDKPYISTGTKGETFFELTQGDVPIRSIKIKNEQLEPASWNHSKGVLEIVIRKKSYHLVSVMVKDANHAPLTNVSVTYKGKKNITLTTDANGQVNIPLPLDEKIDSEAQFTTPGYDVTALNISGGEIALILTPIKPVASSPPPQSSTPAPSAPVPVLKETNEKEYFKHFDLANLDSIQSLTVFYAVFKNLHMKEMDEQSRMRIDNKFNELVAQLADSLKNIPAPLQGKISDSSFVQDDIKNLLTQARQENATLQSQRTDFDEKIQIISRKLESGISNLNASERSALLSDLLALEVLLSENESRFYKNLNDYRDIINGLKEKYFDFQRLETKLSESEALRLEQERVYQQRLLGVSVIVILLGVLIILLIYFSARLGKQKKELEQANAEINRINENLEYIVQQRTWSLAEAHRELDTFLYRASHDLRSPICSIIGLCNIAVSLSDGETKEVMRRVVDTTEGMDKLLKKLRIISEVNQPTDYSSIALLDIVEDVQFNFAATIKERGISFKSECPDNLVFSSNPHLIEAIISNLIDNALFYSAMKKTGEPRVEFKAAIVGDQLEFSVYDNGIGIDSREQHRLFDMFFKGHVDSKGNGLGLYIVQKSVQALKGEVNIKSEAGQFTQVTVRLPLNMTSSQQKLEEAIA